MAFVPLESSADTKPSSGFVPLEESTTPAVESKGGAAFGVYPKPGMEPNRPLSRRVENIGRSAVEAVPGAAAGVYGFGAGMTAVSTPAAAVAGVPVVGPVAAGAIELAGGLGGAFVASGAAQKVTNWMHEVFAPQDFAQRKAEKEAHPYEAFAGETLANLAGMSPKTAPEIAGRLMSKPIAQRVTSAALQTGIEAGTEYATEGKVDPIKLATAAATGAAMPGFNPIGEKAFKAGQRLTSKLAPSAKPDVTSTTSSTDVTLPDATSTPEEHAAVLKTLKERLNKKNAEVPLVEAGMKNTKTGAEERHGPKHSEDRKAELKDDPDWQEGFFDERGNFLTRKEAWNRAKSAKQIAEGQTPELPHEGLHSGDLRTAGDKRFAITEDQPAGVPHETKTNAPKTREQFKSAISNNETDRLNVASLVQEARLQGDTAKAAQHEQHLSELEAQREQLHKDMPAATFKDVANPTGAEIQDHLWGVKNTGQAIDRMLSVQGLGSKSERLLLKALGKSQFIRNADFNLSKDQLLVDNLPALGAYGIEQKHRIDFDKTGNVGTVIHEAIHAGTMKLMREGNSAAAKKLNDLYNEFMEPYEAQYEKALADKLAELNGKMSIGQRSEFRKQWMKDKPYGFTNAEEFIAEALINKEMKQLLTSIESKEPTGIVSNLWNKIRNAIYEGLGVPKESRTMLDDVLDNTMQLVKESKDFDKFKDSPSSILASRLSQDIHDDLQKEGIAVAHSSPHKFGMFNWVEHALKGEGAMAFSAGTYLSTADATDRGYWQMSKGKLKEQYFEHNLEARDTHDYLTSSIDYWDKKVENAENASTQHWDQIYQRQQSGVEGDVHAELRESSRLMNVVNAARKSRDEFVGALKDFEQEHLPKAATYHSTLKAKPEELLDWNSSQQSDVVNKAFESLGVTPSKSLTLDPLDYSYYSVRDADGKKLYSIELDAEGNYGVDYGDTRFVLPSAEEAFAQIIRAESLAGRLKSGERMYYELAEKLRPSEEQVKQIVDQAKEEGHPFDKLGPNEISQAIAESKASIALAEQGVVGNVHDSQFGSNKTHRNYVAYDDTKIEVNFVALAQRPKEAEILKPDPRDVGSEEQFYDTALDIYEKSGDKAALEFYDGFKKYKQTWLEPVKETEKFVGTNLNNKLAAERVISNNKSDILDIAKKDNVNLEQLTYDIDKGEKLDGAAKTIADKFRALMDGLGKRAMDAGVINGWHEDYVARNVVSEGNAPKGALEEFMREVFGSGEGSAMGGVKTTTKYGEPRRLKTRGDLLKHLDGINGWLAENGKDYRFKLKTDNLAEIYADYAHSVEKAIENKNLVTNLKQVRNAAGESLVRPITKEDPLPHGWEVMDNSELAGYAVHPDLMPALKFVFDSGPGNLMQALGQISQLTKRINVIGSFFHAKSLMEVMSSSQIPIWTPVKEAIVLPAIEKGVKALTGKELQLSAVTKAVDQFRKGGVGDNVDMWIKEGGLQLEMPEDVTGNILSAAGKFADEMIGKYGPKTRVLESTMSTVEKYTLGLFDKYTWDYLHTGGKLMVADAYLDKARMQAAKEGKPFDEVAARKEISRFVNDSFGGLNWFDAATSARTEMGKQIAMAAYSPAGRRGLQMALFAPDWTISTLRAFTAALPKELNPSKWHPVEGVKGMLVPTTKADYARLYQFKTALTYLTLVNAINMMTADRPIWENKDPTRIEWPDGTSMQAMKHAMEPYHWIMDPDKTLSNKLGFIPKALIIGVGGLEYASPNAPKLVDRSGLNRLAQVAKSAQPFQVQAAAGAPEGEGAKRAALGTLGFPVYGSTPAQRKLANAERELATKEQAWKYRDKEIKAGRMPMTTKHVQEGRTLEKRRQELDRKTGK